MSRAICLLLIATALLAAPAAAADPTPAPSGSPAPAPDPAPAAIARPSAQLDTYVISVGKDAGWDLGDRVRILRQGKPLGEAIVVTVTRSSASVLLSGSPTVRPQAGDTVQFVRRRKPIPKFAAPTAAAYRPSTTSSTGASGFGPTDWKDVGKVEGLLGEDWMTRNTGTCRVWARKGDLSIVKSIVEGLDASYEVNAAFMGVQPRVPMDFYFFPMENPAHTQPKFAQQLTQRTRFAGIALSHINTALMNLGNARFSRLYEPWIVEETCRHEMNHLFAFSVRGSDRLNAWGWMKEALAEYIENTVKPASSRIDLPAMQSFMQGYRAADANFAALLAERDADDQEQYRDYEKLLASIVFFMREKYGSDCIARLMKASQGKDMGDALVEVCGKDAKGVEADWKAFYGVK